MYNIPVIFYGEMPSDYGSKIKNDKKFTDSEKDAHPGFSQDPLEGLKKEEIRIGGETIESHISKTEYVMEDFECYLPLDKNKYLEKNRNTLAWILSKMGSTRKFLLCG